MHYAEKLASEKGLKAKIIEIGTRYRGKDLMHDVVVVIGKTDEEIGVKAEKMRTVFATNEQSGYDGGDDEADEYADDNA